MVGEFIDVIKLIIEIYKGNVPLNQIYTVIIVILAVALVDSITEIIKAHGSKNHFKIIAESLIYSFIGFTLYLGIYLFILRIGIHIIGNQESLNDSTNVWIAIISYISFVSLFLFFYLCKKKPNIAIKCIIILGYIILTILLMSAINQLGAPQIELPLIILLLTAVLNTLISSFFTIFGTTNIESKSEN